MKNTFFLFFFLFVLSNVNAQVIDPVTTIPLSEKNKGIDSLNKENVIDDIVLKKVRTRRKRRNRRLKNRDYITIDKTVLDSLLGPFYSFSIDSVFSESVVDQNYFKARFRKYIDPFSQDTTYVPLPKKAQYIAPKRIYGIDTLEIMNPFVIKEIHRTKRAKDPIWWRNKNGVALDLNEIAFVNWNAGGSNSVSGLLKFYFERNFEKIYTVWENKISVRYGLNAQEEDGLRKTDDEIKLSSTYGFRQDTISNWYYSAKFSFNTQLTDGYKYPDTDNPISRFFAPAYVFVGAGAKYYLRPNNFSVYLSPTTFKSTYVLDDQLSSEGSFGVEKGEKARHELGFLVQSNWLVGIFENVAMTNSLSLYTDYLNNFGNIDVDWTFKLQFKINNFLEANFRTHMIYDDDIKFESGTDGNGEVYTYGARLQLKQQLGIGFLYSF